MNPENKYFTSSIFYGFIAHPSRPKPALAYSRGCEAQAAGAAADTEWHQQGKQKDADYGTPNPGYHKYWSSIPVEQKHKNQVHGKCKPSKLKIHPFFILMWAHTVKMSRPANASSEFYIYLTFYIYVTFMYEARI